MSGYNEQTLLEFPCEFSIKAFGSPDGDFETLVLTLIQAHAPDLTRRDLRIRHSGNGRYIAVTATITASSKAQLDAIYHALSNHDRVLMSL